MSKKTVPTDTQLQVLLRAVKENAPLERRAGGFWTTSGTPAKDDHSLDVPLWWVSVQTIQAMEKRGWLRRTNRFPESWRDDREVTEEGRMVTQEFSAEELPAPKGP